MLWPKFLQLFPVVWLSGMLYLPSSPLTAYDGSRKFNLVDKCWGFHNAFSTCLKCLIIRRHPILAVANYVQWLSYVAYERTVMGTARSGNFWDCRKWLQWCNFSKPNNFRHWDYNFVEFLHVWVRSSRIRHRMWTGVISLWVASGFSDARVSKHCIMDGRERWT